MKFLKSYKIFEFESNAIQVKSFTTKELSDFLDDRKESVKDLENRLRFFKYPFYTFGNDDDYYSILFDSDEIIGVCKISSYEDLKKSEMEISYCSIDRDHRGRGYLNILIKEVIRLCKERNISLGASRWTVPGYLKLRPTIKKWASKYNVKFRDHELKFDYPSAYNADMINLNEMTPEELEKFQKLKRYKSKYKGIFKNIFYDTGKYKIYSTQNEFDKSKINKIFQDISGNEYDFFSDKGKIAGYFHKGKYYVTEGHHRILAALKYWRIFNDYQPVDKMIKNGNFVEKNPVSENPKKFPIKMMENKFNNFL